MSVRIRYSKDGEGNLVSKQKFNHATNGMRYRVMISPSKCKWMVIDDKCDSITAEGTRDPNAIKVIDKMKIEVKEALLKFEIDFGKERRVRAKKAE